MEQRTNDQITPITEILFNIIPCRIFSENINFYLGGEYRINNDERPYTLDAPRKSTPYNRQEIADALFEVLEDEYKYSTWDAIHKQDLWIALDSDLVQSRESKILAKRGSIYVPYTLSQKTLLGVYKRLDEILREH